MPPNGYKWNQLGGLADSFYEKSSEESLKILRAEFKRVFNKLIKWVESLFETELFDLHQREWAGGK